MRGRWILGLGLLWLGAALAAAASEKEHSHAEHPPAQEAGAGNGESGERLRPQIPDPVLIDQDGRPHRFYSELLKGKLVLMNSIYTSCPGTCPMQSSVFAGVQRLLGERLGSDVVMISVSLDPVTDTPERLKEFSQRFRAGPGWLLLTGPPEDVKEVLQAMDLYSADPAAHAPIAAIGNEPAGLWMKVVNLTSPTDLLARLERVEELGRRYGVN
jgi:cytochrome oxidase Cu insertion factor (SCO1/SenC/PrrC family)